MSPTPDLGIVIVNWNTRDLLRECLTSVYASRGVTFCVCVVDNASSDNSAALVSSEFPQATLIVSAENVGYPAGNNLGLRELGFDPLEVRATSSSSLWEDEEGNRAAPPRYALLLNPDTVLPPDALAQMVAYMDAHPECGVSGPKLVLPDGSLDLACRRSFPSPEVSFYRLTGLSLLFPKSRLFGRYNLTYLDPDVETEVDSVVGAFMLVRREAIAQVGLLDERFFMYGEDLDWAFEIKRKGWTTRYYPRVTVLHVKRAASRKSHKAQIAFHESMLLFYRKHYAASTNPLLGGLVELSIRLNGWRTRLSERFVRR